MNLSRFLTSPNGHFARHYVEMVLAMVAGMVVLGGLVEGALWASGTSTNDLSHTAPAVPVLAMAVEMTLPMVAWMRYRGHGWGASAEMAASMFLPTFVVIVLMSVDLVGFWSAMSIEHSLMFVSMFGAMLLRRNEYSRHIDHAAPKAV